MSMIAALAVTSSAWMSGDVSALGALGLYIGVGFAVMFVSLGGFLWLDARRSRPRSLRIHDRHAPMPAVATVPARNASSDWTRR
jgi:hypothetical protein